MSHVVRVAVSIQVPGREPEATFALDALLGAVGVVRDDGLRREESVLVHYGSQPPDRDRPSLWIQASSFFGQAYGTNASLPGASIERLDGLPVLFSAGDETPRVLRSELRIETSVDLVAATFFLLSGYEETVDGFRDEHGRFPAARSAASRAGLTLEPLVDRYAAWLASLLGELAGCALAVPAWDREGFALALSHDVDGLRPPQRPEGRASSVVAPILELEARHDVHSTFFFITGGEDPVRERYEITDKRARRALREVRRAGSEIALHGSYFCMREPGCMEAEKAALCAAVKEPRGYRQHYLRLPADGLARLDRAGFRYDSSLSWPDAPGFKNGTARPFHPYDFGQRRALALLEIPLVVMDRTLEKYLALDAQAAWGVLLEILVAIETVGGCSALLWHPEFFDSLRHPGYDALYEKTLVWLRDSGGRALTGKQVARAWKRRDRTDPHVHG
ncbi:MAG: polysaccharide deacetylase family protein [Planctomycetota bacterium]